MLFSNPSKKPRAESVNCNSTFSETDKILATPLKIMLPKSLYLNGQYFAKGLFDVDGTPVFTPDKLDSIKYSFEFIRDDIFVLPGVSTNAANIVIELVSTLNNTITNPATRLEPSTITAVGHTWSSIFSGVALTKIPPARNLAKIQDSILEIDSGLVIASGQDDQGSALFVGGMTIDADTGELGGAPFTSAVNRIANKIVISRSF